MESLKSPSCQRVIFDPHIPQEITLRNEGSDNLDNVRVSWDSNKINSIFSEVSGYDIEGNH